MRSDVNPLDLVEGDLLRQAIVELGGAGGLVAGDACGDLKIAAVSQVLGDPGATEAVGGLTWCGHKALETMTAEGVGRNPG